MTFNCHHPAHSITFTYCDAASGKAAKSWNECKLLKTKVVRKGGRRELVLLSQRMINKILRMFGRYLRS